MAPFKTSTGFQIPNRFVESPLDRFVNPAPSGPLTKSMERLVARSRGRAEGDSAAVDVEIALGTQPNEEIVLEAG
jgi:2,4-dienoyl-CoA reductase-like NADH-dependent reductase (Old Yellow Enzyme family)